MATSPPSSDLLDPQAELIFEGSPAIPSAGVDAATTVGCGYFQAIGESLDDVVFVQTMKPFAVQGDQIVFHGRYAARVKSTGKIIDSPLVHLWTIRSGKVIGCHELTNTAMEASACTMGAEAVQ